MFQRRLTKEEKKEIEEKRISILPKTGIKQNNELLTLKVFGYSNLKIISLTKTKSRVCKPSP